MASDDDKSKTLRLIPKVDELLAEVDGYAAAKGIPRWIMMDAIRAELDEIRARVISSPTAEHSLVDKSAIQSGVRRRAEKLFLFRLRRVINGTGIIIHTNLGRAVLAAEAAARLAETALGYSNLEYDLDTGERGSRHDHLRGLIGRLTGAEDALVVNNNAAAVLLALNTLARGREVIVSRGELVEIGGSFRIPDIMARSGAILREVGTTNRTSLKDYREAINTQTALLLKVHTSNYRVIGFTEAVTKEQLAALGKERGIPVFEDLGSGCLADLSAFGLNDEPVVQRSLEAGMDLVTFSGDKLLGGPQAGIAVGRGDIIKLLSANPLHRALRIDKFIAAALEATLRLYLEGEAAYAKIPVLAMVSADVSKLRRTGAAYRRRWRRRLPSSVHIDLVSTTAHMGGGSLPTREIPSLAFHLNIDGMSADDIAARLRGHEPAIIGRIDQDRFLLDLRTLLPDDFADIEAALASLDG